MAEEDWEVISNSPKISKIKGTREDKEFGLVLKRFGLSEPESNDIVQSFDGVNFVCHEFERTKPISTYLYCIVAGPFDELLPAPGKEHPTIPMRLYCRKSLTKYAEKWKDDWFRITQIGIKYYEKVFATPYPFGKFD